MRPDIAVLLNLTPDHLDRHGSFEAYGRAKARMFENQTEGDAAVLNADDAVAPQYAPARPRVFWFSRAKRVASGCYLRGDQIVFRRDGDGDRSARARAISACAASHNVENVLAAAAAAMLAGVEPARSPRACAAFAGVEHRLEFVATISGVEYFNDSKATNVDATLKALDAFPGNVLVILGGKDKGSDYSASAPGAAQPRAHGAADRQRGGKNRSATCRRHPRGARGDAGPRRGDRLRRARPGDTVLLAPACASFDQFENYEHRGRVFKQLVRELEKEHAA